jgi:hypothetical protein
LGFVCQEGFGLNSIKPDNYQAKAIKKYVNYILLFLVTYYLLVDSVNGFLLRQGFFSISLLYKFLILGMLFLYFFNKQSTQLIIGILLLYMLVHTFMIGNPLVAGSGLIFLVRFFLIVMLYQFFLCLLNNHKENHLIYFVKVSYCILVINLLLGGMGFGYAQYGEGRESEIGTRGFLYAGNELVAAVITSGSILLMYLIEKRKYLLFSIIGILTVFMGALLASKASLLATLLIILFFPMIKALSRLNSLKILKSDFYYFSAILFTIPIIAIGSFYYALYMGNLIVRWEYFYNKVDLVTFLMSNRNVWHQQAMDGFINHYTLTQWFFGSGNTWWVYISGNNGTEIDLIDFLMTYGIVGVLITYGFWLYVIKRSFSNRANNPYFGYVVFMLLLLLGLSLTSGHIMNSGIAGPLIAGLLAMANYKRS